MGIPLDRNGPQSGTRQRFNPIHTMFRDGGDAPKTAAEVAAMEGYGGSDDWIVMPLQCVTQWDSLAHIFSTRGRCTTATTRRWSPAAARPATASTRPPASSRGAACSSTWPGTRA